jgi:L-threonylcarbamoyladenylate synthase
MSNTLYNMEIYSSVLAKKLKQGEVAIIPTDTIYGIVGSAKIPETVERIYTLKSRKTKKPLVILISSLSDLEIFKIKLTRAEKEILEKVWPGKVSVILPCPQEKFFYLHRGKKSLAFRLPEKKNLLEIIKKTGPLVSTSANPEGLPYAKTISEAKKYFGKEISLYADEGKLDSLPSTLIEIRNEKMEILRQGEVKI